MTDVHEHAHIAQASLPTKSRTHCCVWMCAECVHEYYGMAAGGVVRQGSGGGRVGGELCVHGGRGQREWTTHEYYGVMVVLCGGGGGLGKIAVYMG